MSSRSSGWLLPRSTAGTRGESICAARDGGGGLSGEGGGEEGATSLLLPRGPSSCLPVFGVPEDYWRRGGRIVSDALRAVGGGVAGFVVRKDL